MYDRLWVLAACIRTRGALRTYLFLLSRCDEGGTVKISRADIAASVSEGKLAGVYNAHIVLWVRELEELGLLSIQETKPGATNTYKIVRPTVQEVLTWQELRSQSSTGQEG